MKVEVRIKKCKIWSHSSQNCQSGRKAYTVKLCEIKL